MSVLVLEPESFEGIYSKMKSYTFRKQCDINYSFVLCNCTDTELKRLIESWVWLNEMSYIRAYREDSEPTLFQFLRLGRADTPNTYQTLKWLECLRYNIEIDTIRHGRDSSDGKRMIKRQVKKDYDTLIRVIDDIRGAIIAELDDYKNSKWG